MRLMKTDGRCFFMVYLFVRVIHQKVLLSPERRGSFCDPRDTNQKTGRPIIVLRAYPNNPLEFSVWAASDSKPDRLLELIRKPVRSGFNPEPKPSFRIST